MCDRMGLRAVTRTQLAAATEPLANGSAPDVVVVNSTGELGSLYKRATLAFVGKSLRGQGGQNFIEAAAVGAPIVVRPNMQNFKVITPAFINHQAVVHVTAQFVLPNSLHATNRRACATDPPCQCPRTPPAAATPRLPRGHACTREPPSATLSRGSRRKKDPSRNGPAAAAAVGTRPRPPSSNGARAGGRERTQF